MHSVSRLAARLGLVFCAVVAVTLASCSSSGGQPPQAAVSTPTLRPLSTLAPTATPTPPGEECGPGLNSSLIASSGDLRFTALNPMTMYGPYQLPDALPLKPYALKGPGQYLDGLPAVNVSMYSFMVCNASKTQTHVLRDVKVKLESFVADTNAINTSQYCIRLYSRQGMLDQTGCGGGYGGGDAQVKASFAATSAVGTVASTVDADTDQPLAPLSIVPGYGVSIFVNVTPPSTPGTATYRIGYAFDTGGPIYPAPASVAVTTSTKLRAWDGNSCLPTAMQQQVPPATNPPTYYICPHA